METYTTSELGGSIEGPPRIPGEPDGVIFEVPEMANASLEEQEAYLRRLLQEDTPAPSRSRRAAGRPTYTPPEARRLPTPPVPPAPAEPPPSADGSRPGIFNRRTLYSRDAYRVEWFEMSDGSGLYIHPLSSQQQREIRLQLLDELTLEQQDSPTLDERLSPRELERQKKLLGADLAARSEVLQVIACARQGPEPEAEAVFIEADREALTHNPGWAEAVGQIVTRSNALMGGQTEADLLKAMMTSFFSRMQSFHEILLFRLNSALPDSSSKQGKTKAWRAVREVADSLEDYVTSVSNTKLPEKFSPEAVQGLCMVMGTE